MPLPSALAEHIDRYVDSLGPEIQPRIVTELENFQNKTIDSLEDQVVDAFRSLFNKDKDGGGGGNNNNNQRRMGDADAHARQLDPNPPDSYGGQSLPFADEIAALTKGFGNIADGAGDDLGEIFNLIDGRSGGGGGGGGDMQRSRGGENENPNARSRGGGFDGFLSAAVNFAQDKIEDKIKQGSGGGGGGIQLDGLLGVLSDTVKDTARNPEEKARMISPEIKEHVGIKLREQHAPIAEQFTKIALDHLKRWLRGNTDARDLGDGMKGEIKEQVQDLVKGLGGLFGNKDKERGGDGQRSMGGDGERGEGGSGGGGFSKVISDKLSTGLARVHREVRLEFRKILGAIEKQLFELLPDSLQRPLEKILGGNPFDSQLDQNARRDGGNQDRGGGDFVDDIKAKLVNKIRDLVRKVQMALRENILGIVNGGHRKFERESWVFVQNMVEVKVNKYLPDVRITVPDDIGNEGVGVGKVEEKPGFQGRPSSPGRPQSGGRPSSPGRPQQQYQPPPQQQHDSYQQQQQQQYQQQQHYPPPPPQQQYGQDQYSQGGYQQGGHQQGGYQQGGYQQNQQYGHDQYQQGGYQDNQYGQNPRY